jgi:chitodextrinase
MRRSTLRSAVLVSSLVMAGTTAISPLGITAASAGSVSRAVAERSQDPDVSVAQQATAEVEALASALRDDSGRRNAVAARLRAVASRRKSALLRLAKSDPQAATTLLLPASTLSTLATISGDLLEKKVTVSGQYGVVHRDDPQGNDTFTSQVSTRSGVLSIYTNGRMPTIKPGSTVSVTGYRLDQSIIAYAAGSTSTASVTTVSAPSSTTPLGPLGVAVILANFSNSTTPLDPNVPKAAFQGNPGQDVDSWYSEASLGKSSLSPSFYGPYTISDATSSGACPNLSTAGNNAMKAASPYLTYSQFRRIVIVFNCTGYGASTSVGEGQVATPQGTITGAVTYADSSFLGDRYGYVHELSHNLGNYHAAFFDCQPGSFVPPSRFAENCSSAEYGNEFDALGATLGSPRATPHLDAYHTNNAGWFGSGNYVSVATPGTYTYKLLPYETPTSGLVALNIPRGTSGTAFTLEYRQPIGFDSWMASSNTSYCSGQCTATKGPILQLAYPQSGSGGGSDTQAIDTTPNSIASNSYYPIEDNRDGALLPGKTFTDPEYGISVTTQAADSTGATVQVTVPAAATCTRQAPTVTLLSPSTQSAAPGQTLQYTVSVTSHDSTSCTAEAYKYLGGQLTGISGTGQTDHFTAVASPDTFTLAPGATTNVTASLTPDATVVDGAYSFSSTPSGGIGSIQADSLNVSNVSVPNVTFQVTSASDTTPPSTPTNLVAKALGSNASTVTWSPSPDNIGVGGYKVLVDNAYLYYVAATSFTPYNLSAGTTHTISVQAFDRQGNLSAAGTTSLTLPTKTDVTAPTAPGALSASVSDRSLSLSWVGSTDNVAVIGYVVSPFNTWLPAGSTSVTVANLATNASYSLNVQAVDGSGNLSPASASSLSVTTAHSGSVAPTRPSLLYSPSATTTGGVQLSWGASTDPAGVSGYYVYRNGRRWATVTSTSYTDPTNDLYATGAGYQYYVEAYDAAGNLSAPTPFVQVISPNTTTADTTAPTGASLTAPTAGATVSGSTTLSTAPSDNVGVSKVEFYVNGAFIGQSNVSPYTLVWNTTPTYNGAHTVYARAYDAAGNYSTASITTVTVSNGGADTSPPTAPTNLTATPASPTQANLTWTASTDNVGVAGYTVYRNGAAVGTATGTSWSDTGVVGSTTYSYDVVAHDTAGNVSAASTTASVTTPAPADTTPPTTPTNLTATASGSTRVDLAWTASTDNLGVAGYTVYRNGAAVGTATGTSWSDTGVVGSTTYSYDVVAYDGAGNVSPASNTTSVTTTAPTGVTENGAISGTVTRKSNGAPLANVKVTITIGGTQQTYLTSSSGTFAISGVPAGTYPLTFSAKGSRSQSVTVSVTAGQTATANVSM